VQKFSTKTFGDLLDSYVLNVYHQRIEWSKFSVGSAAWKPFE
jgi:hypothetical protein